MPAPPPFESHADAFGRFLQIARDPSRFRGAFEELLVNVSPRAAAVAEWGMRESVGAAALLRPAPDGEATLALPTLILGSGFLGTAPAVARFDREVIVVDDDPARIQFVNLRAAASNLNIRGLHLSSGAPLPFPDAFFRSIIIPDAPGGLPNYKKGGSLQFWLREARRTLRPGGDFIMLCANRFAYKRFTGMHGRFEQGGIGGYAKRALFTNTEERGASGYRASLREAGLVLYNEYSAYVSHLDYHYIAALDRKQFPRLEIGRKEKKNLLKWIGYRAGLFPRLTPSFIFCATTAANEKIRNNTILDGVARDAVARAGGILQKPRVEHLLATRGNAAIAMIGGDGPGVIARVPLCAKEDRLGALHLQISERLRTTIPNFPAPRAFGEIVSNGARVFVEERLDGYNSAQYIGDDASRRRTYLQLAERLAKLIIKTTVLDESALEEVLYSRARHAAARVRDERTALLITKTAAAAGKLLKGKACPLVLSHGDLRAKHCLVRADGTITGILDWGTAREPNLPLFDLIHFIIHDRKQQFEETLDAAAIRTLLPRNFSPFEAPAVEQYCSELALDADVRRACELLYPLEVAATAFYNWDYDRPRWVETNFSTFLHIASSTS